MAAALPPKNPTGFAPRRDAVVNLRVSQALRDLIDHAAQAAGKTRTDFIIESARQRAIDALLEQRLFPLAEDQYAAFLEALDAPPAPNEKLKRLIASPAPWEK